MVLGLVFSRALYFVMVVLQFIVVCLVVILWAFALAFLPMLAKSSIHFCVLWSLWGWCGMVIFLIRCRALMYGLLWMCM